MASTRRAKKFREPLRDKIGKKLMEKGKKMYERESTLSQAFAKRLWRHGFNLSRRERENIYKEYGSLREGGKVQPFYVDVKELEGTGGFFEPGSGRIFLPHKLTVPKIEGMINEKGFKSREQVLSVLRKEIKARITNKKRAKEAIDKVGNYLAQRKGKKSPLFYFKEKERFQEYLDYIHDRSLTHETRHLKEGLEKGFIPVTRWNIRKHLREELVAEYDATLRHDGIKGRKLPKKHKKLLEEFLKWEYGQYKKNAAREKRAYNTTEKLEKIMKKGEKKVRTEMKQNLDLLEKMHNSGASFEEIHARLLRLKERKINKPRQ